jgi:acyl carrier protein
MCKKEVAGSVEEGCAVEENEIFDRVKKIVAAQLGVAADTVTMSANFAKDLGADPVDAIEVELALQEEFDMEIADVDAQKIRTVGDAVRYIKSVL